MMKSPIYRYVSSGVFLLVLSLMCQASFAAVQLRAESVEGPVFAEREKAQQTKPLRLGLPSGSKSGSNEYPHYRWLEHSLKALGYHIELNYLPGKRLLQQVNQGLMDGDLSRVPEAVVGFEHLVQVPTPFIRTCYRGYGFQSLSGSVQRVGSIRGAVMIEDIARERWGDTFTPLNSFEQGVRLLVAGRIDLMLLPTLVEGSIFLKRFEVSSGLTLKRLTPLVAEFDTYIYLHEQHRAIAPALAHALSASRAQYLPSGGCQL